MNFFDVTVDSVSGATAAISAPGLAPMTVSLADGAALKRGDRATLGIRPENIRLSPDDTTRAAIPARYASSNISAVKRSSMSTPVPCNASVQRAARATSRCRSAR